MASQQRKANNIKNKSRRDKKRPEKLPTNVLPEIKIDDISDNPNKNVTLLDNHPLVRKSTTVKDILGFNIIVENYSLNTHKAKSFGIKTISDDGIYEALDYMRKLLPRGLAIVTFQHDGETETVTLFGFRKFSGMEDDSEEKINLEKAERYFRKGSMSNVTHFMKTNKSNGENAKWTFKTVFDKIWVLAGSKNTCKVFPLGLNPQHWYPVQSNNDYGNIIANEVYNMLEQMDAKEKLDEFVKHILRNSYVLMGELNHPQSEHVFPINELKIEHVAILGQDGTEVNPDLAFNIFNLYHLPRVEYSLKPISELENTLQEIIDDKTCEGSVLYLLQEKDESYIVLSLLKHKSSFYVVARRIRQNFWKILVDPLIEFPGINKQLITALAKKCQQELKKKIPQLTFLPNCKDKKEEWVSTGTNFISWWVLRYVTASSLENKMKFLDDAKYKYGTTYHTFIQNPQCEDLKNDTKEKDEPCQIIILRGPSGCGKTYFADRVDFAFDIFDKKTVVVSADDYFEEKGKYIPNEIQLAHKDCQRKALAALREGHIVIVVNTNIQLWEMQAYIKMSQLLDISVKIMDVPSFDNEEKPINWKNKKSADQVAKVLHARTVKRDTWREEIPIGVITGQIKRFEPCESIVDILLANVPRFVQCAPAKGVYNKRYAGFAHPILMSWVQKAVETLKSSNEHSDIEKYFDNALLRDSFVKHIILAFWKSLPQNLDQDAFMSKLRHLSLKDFKNIGIGMVDGKHGSRAYYVIIDSPRLKSIYKSFGLENKCPTLHVTIGFRKSDVHGVSKGVETLLKL